MPIFQSLLVLRLLTRENVQIQKLVAFENAFERIFDIIGNEAFADGGYCFLHVFLLISLKPVNSYWNFP